MDFNPDTWGTVAEWVGGLGTTFAFLVTALVVYRDASTRKESQARKVAYYLREVDRDPEDFEDRYTKWWDLEVHNLSDEPIYRIQQHHRYSPGFRMPLQRRFHDVLLPGKHFVMRQARYPSKSRLDVQFSDNSGRTWIRTLKGDLHIFRPRVEVLRAYIEYRREARVARRKGFKNLNDQIRREYEEIAERFEQDEDSPDSHRGSGWQVLGGIAALGLAYAIATRSSRRGAAQGKSGSGGPHGTPPG